jgi:hypothetical protein
VLELIDPSGGLVYSNYCVPYCDFRGVSCSFSDLVTLPMTGEYTVIIADLGRDESGTCSLAVNCQIGCPPLNNTTVRNGTGINRSFYHPISPASLGGAWSAKVDVSLHPGAALTSVHIYRSPHPGLASPYGEILVDLSSGRLCARNLPVATGSTENVYCEAVPAIVALLGVSVSTQAFIAGGGIELSNAIDYVVGY